MAAIPGKPAPHAIQIEIAPDGKITSTVEGIEGPTCSELTRWLEELGAVEVDRPTADWRKIPRQTIINRH